MASNQKTQAGAKPRRIDVPATLAKLQGRWAESHANRLGHDQAVYDDQKHHGCPNCGQGKDTFRHTGMGVGNGACICEREGVRASDGIRWQAHCLGLDPKDDFHELVEGAVQAIGETVVYESKRRKLKTSTNGKPATNGKAASSENSNGNAKEPVDPAKHLVFRKLPEVSDRCLDAWADERGLPPGTLQAIGCLNATYRRGYNVAVAPVWGPKLLQVEPVGYAMQRAMGRGRLPVFKGPGEEPEWVKTKVTAGSDHGWIGRPAIENWDAAEVIWKVEGISDLAAISSKIPEDLRNTQLVVTNAFGARERLKKWQAAMLKGKRINIVHDADKAGEEGGTQFAHDAARAGAIVTRVRLPYPTVESHGKDLRDWLEEGNDYNDLQALAEQGERIDASQLPPEESKEDDDKRSSAEIKLSLGLHDVGNAELFVRLWSEDVLHVANWRKWLRWDGCRWADDSSRAVDLMTSTMKRLEEEVETKTRKESDQLLSWAVESQSSKRVSAALILAAANSDIVVEHDQLDAHPWQLNTRNGTVDLKTGELRTHDCNDFHCKVTACEIADTGFPARWLDFCHEIFAGDVDLILFVQRLIGSALVGEVYDHLLPIFYGGGANGKGVFVDTITDLLGDYAQTCQSEMLLASKHDRHPTEVAALFRIRFAPISETDAGRRLAEARVKTLTGGERLSARRMREDFWDFRPSHTPVLVTNHLPDVRGTDYGIWRRLRVVPFNVTIPEHKRDPDLKRKLEAEWPEILRWAVNGCMDWQRSGLDEVEAIRLATGEYRVDNDAIGQFVAECCVTSPNAMVRGGKAYEAYRGWCEDRRERPMGNKRFADEFLKHASGKVRNNGAVYLGVGLAADRD